VPLQDAAHVPVPVQLARIWPRTAPVTVTHLPSELASPHDWHCPEQADSQQTESTQLLF
jgi:hypothetical protein